MNDELLQTGLNGLYLLLVATWRAFPLLLIVSLSDLVLRRRLAPKYQAILWSVVVIRLMLPFSLPSPWSMHGPLDQLVAAVLGIPASEPTPSPARYGASIDISDQPLAWPPAPVTPQEPPPRGASWEQLWATALVAVWALVAAGAVLRSVTAHLRFAWRLRTCRDLDEPRLIDVVLRECDLLRVPRRPQLKEVPELAAPAVFGLFRSTVCLPVGAIESLSPQELRWVLRHELAHVSRRDAWLLSFALIVRSLHWFNPLAWFATSRLRVHVEAAADDLALGGSSSIDAIAYGRLLLRYVASASSQNASPAVGLLQFVAGRRLRGRIERLTRDRTAHRRRVRWSIGFATLALSIVSLTDAAPPSAPRPPAIHLPAADLTVVKSRDTDEGPTSLRTYDVAEVLERIREMESGDDAELVLTALYPGMAPSPAMRLEGGNLIAELTERRHQELSRALDAWRIGGPRQITIEIRIIRANLSLAASIDWAAKINDLEQRGSRPMVATRIREDQLRRFVRGVSADSGGELLMAPKVTVFNGRTATIASLVQRPFVTGIEPREDGSLQPVTELYDDGYKVTLQPATTGDGAIDLTFDLQTSTIGEVALANLPFRHPQAPYPNVTVQVPSVFTASARSTVRLPATESVLIAAPQVFHATSAEASTMAVFYAFTPRLLDDAELTTEAPSPPKRSPVEPTPVR